MKKLAYRITILILLISIPNIVKAESSQFNVCLNNSLYSIMYDSSAPITKDMIGVNSDGKPELISGGSDYKVTFTEIGSRCRNDGDTIINCPEDGSIYRYSKIREAYLKEVDETSVTVTDNIIFNFNTSTGKFNIVIKDKFNDKLYIRYVSSERELNTSINSEASKYIGNFLTRTGSNYYINNVDSQKIVYLEFYIKDSSSKCKDTYIGYISFATPSLSDYEVDNPAISNPKAYSCDLIKEYKPTGMVNSDDIDKLESLKKSYIYECYTTGKVPFGTVGVNGTTLKKTIADKYEKLKEMFSTYKASATTGSHVCTDLYSVGSRVTYASSGKYWSMVCTESYQATGSEAKLVKAGGGFDYQANYTITRQCTITQIAKPSKSPKCSYSTTHSCDWNMSNGTRKGCSGADCDGGPNDDFDICVKECDNGKYSQECINSCYQSVYKSDRKLSINDQLLVKEGNVKFTSLVDTKTFTSANSRESCTTAYNRDGYKIHYDYIVGGRVVSSDHNACFSTNFCAGKGAGACTFYTYKEPDSCVEDPDAKYISDLNASEAELNQFIAKQNESVPTGNYTYKITDSYLKTNAGKNYVFTVNSTDNPAIKVESTENKSSSNHQTVSLGSSGGRNVSYNGTVTVVANITTSLPLSYVSKVNGNIAYKTSNSDRQAFSVNHKLNRIESLTDFDKASYYSNNERKYYTSIWSDNINVMMLDGKYSLFRTSDDYNILVESSNVGGGSFGSNIDCYYGVYNNFYCKDQKDCPGELDQIGIQYIYRVIDLTDVFPNERSPRWNWTGTLNTGAKTSSGAASFASKNRLEYDVDPIEKTKDIESKGETIYDVQKDSSEVDYEFVLTKENLKNIRAYNKKVRDYNGDGYNNYLDYNMSCYKNSKGKEICTSKFLDNINGSSGTDSSDNFITYSVSGFTIDTRKELAGCNDSKNLSCIDKYH